MYSATITHFNGTTGRLDLDATTDAEAIAEISKIAVDGYRSGTSLQTTLANGNSYGVRNASGRAVGKEIECSNDAFAHL